MPSLSELVKSLSVAFESKKYETCQKLLPAIKIELIKNNLVIPDVSSQNETYLKDLQIAERFFEVGALVSIYSLDLESFESYFAQLRVFYFSPNQQLSESDNKSKILSLNMLILLSQGEITKFHSELEFLSKHIRNLEEDGMLSYPIRVERWLMEGSYQRAWDLLKSGSKQPEFDIFTETLMNTIREEIARNTEMAYERLPLSNVKVLLFFNSEKEAEQFAIRRGWKVVSGMVEFEEEEEPSEPQVEKPSLIEKTLNYAINLESIV